jgi:hypothetical protein
MKLLIFLLTYRASTHEATGPTPASIVFRRDLHLLCDLLFGALSYRDQSATYSVVDLEDWQHDIHNYSRQHMKVASDRMKAH